MNRSIKKLSGSGLVICVLGLMLFVGMVGSSSAMPPHPDIRAKIAESEETERQYLDELRDLRAKGVDAPSLLMKNLVAKKAAGLSATLSGPFKILVLLVDFSDQISQVNPTFFDGLMFDSVGISVRTYYDEVSYSQFDIVTVNMPSTTGWYRAPETYTYYVDGQYGLGTHPNNTQKLIEDLVDLADADVDFSQYDNDGDGYVDGLTIVHSGPGREFSGSDDDIHSHKWAIDPRLKDGVFIFGYSIQPEYLSVAGDMTIGVFCHEIGHIFGLPDLYDTDYSSQGIGKWGLMSFGSWNGTNGSSPAHLSAWCRQELGWGTVVNVTSNMNDRSINSVESGGSMYRLWSNGDSTSNEYFLVENRQRTGYDSGLPSDGLLIWHIDEGKISNVAEWWPGLSGANHYSVALEQADGLWDLEHDANSGDAGDPFPGSTVNTSFTNITSPNSDSYEIGATVVAVNNISASSATMTADLIVGISAGVDNGNGSLPVSAELSQNYPNPFNPETTIGFTLSNAGDVKLEIFNIIGQRVKTLIEGSVESGTTTISWDATTENGHRVASGIYFYKLTTESSEESKKMVLVR